MKRNHNKTFVFIPATISPFNFRQYSELYSREARDARGYPARVKVTSIKTWKTHPDVEIHWKYGLYDYGTIQEYQLKHWAVDYREYQTMAYTKTWRRDRAGNVKITK